jgi:hypothetical protein
MERAREAKSVTSTVDGRFEWTERRVEIRDAARIVDV